MTGLLPGFGAPSAPTAPAGHVPDLASYSAKRTRSGARMTFGGDDRALGEWTTGRRPYKPLRRVCRVCGATKSKPAASSCGGMEE